MDETISEVIGALVAVAIASFFISRKFTAVDKDVQFLKDELKELKKEFKEFFKK